MLNFSRHPLLFKHIYGKYWIRKHQVSNIQAENIHNQKREIWSIESKNLNQESVDEMVLEKPAVDIEKSRIYE